jgi:hypothetical protein
MEVAVLEAMVAEVAQVQMEHSFLFSSLSM